MEVIIIVILIIKGLIKFNFDFNDPIKVALIAASASLVGVWVNIYLHISNREDNNKKFEEQKKQFEITLQSETEKMSKDLSARYITDKRVDWIENLRVAVSEYISLVNHLICSKQIGEEERLELNKTSAYIFLLLNFSGEIDGIIINIIEEINKEISEIGISSKEKIRYNLMLVQKHTQVYLKLEWNRVKMEIKDQKYTEDTLHREILDLYSKMVNEKVIKHKEIQYVMLDFLEKYGDC